MKRFNYYYLGMNIESCMQLPELSVGLRGELDVEIRFGKVPEMLPDATSTGVRYQAAPGRLLFHVDEVASFLICDGQEIIIEFVQPLDEDSVRLFLLGTSFGALLQQRGVLPLHGTRH